MVLQMVHAFHDTRHARRGHLLKMTTARSVRFFVNLGLGLVFMGCLLNAVLCHYSSVDRFQETVLGGSISCLVALMVLDFGRVINLTLT